MKEKKKREGPVTVCAEWIAATIEAALSPARFKPHHSDFVVEEPLFNMSSSIYLKVHF